MKMAQNSQESSSLTCCVVLEWQTSDSTVLRRANLKSVTLRLVRNEFREIFLEVIEKLASKKYHLKNINVHKKFMSEGKASVHFQELNMVLLISNAPPTSLSAFLKHMYIKLCGNKGEKIGPRTKLLSNKSQVVEDISPVTLKEINGIKSKVQTPGSTPPTGKKRGNAENKMSAKRTCLTKYLEPMPLTKEQKTVLEQALAGKNLFFTGSAGTGKSHLLRRIIGALPPDLTMATASTGVAACHIGGMTLHSFAGIGSGQASLDRCVQLASRPAILQGWRKCRHLIIDEISMVQGSYFELLENVARIIRNSDQPFGGIQLILCGDFLQLPPVSRESEEKNFCFESSAWDKCIHASYELTKVHRQSDPVFIDILQNLRIGRVTTEICDKLMETSRRRIDQNGIVPTRLCTHTKDSEQINKQNLERLPGTIKTFVATDSHSMSSNQMDQQTNVPSKLELKVGAQVMLLKNLNVSEGLVNGARGIVIKFDSEGFPIVQFRGKTELTMKPEKWTIKGGGGMVWTRRQIPLKLAWAFSIHKSQGLTLDCVEMSLAKVFEPGQAYVALSRAKSLDCLKVIDFDPKQVWANPQVLEFYRKFRRKMSMMEIIPLGKKAHIEKETKMIEMIPLGKKLILKENLIRK